MPTPIDSFSSDPVAILGIYSTNHCNLTCRHCCTNSRPSSKTRIQTLDSTIKQIPSLIEAHGVKAIHVSGGEPFLYQDDLRSLGRCAMLNSISLAINTNSFWARTLDDARRLLSDIPGVTQLFLSASEYHQKFLPIEAVFNAARAAGELGLLTYIGIVTGDSQTTFAESVMVHANDIGLNNVRFIVRRVETGGRATSLPEAHWRKELPVLPSGRCVQINRPVILEDGRVAACCNTTGVQLAGCSPLILGDMQKESLTAILQRSRIEPIYQALRILGPKYLAEQLPKEMRDRLPKRFLEDDICSLCVPIMSDDLIVATLLHLLKNERLSNFIRASDQLLTSMSN